jgi:hypothetical protein
VELTAELVLDVSHSDGLRLRASDGNAPEYGPDVLIVPSRLKHFAKVRVRAPTRSIWLKGIVWQTVYTTSFVSKGTYIVLDVVTRGAGDTKTRLSARLEKLQ